MCIAYASRIIQRRAVAALRDMSELPYTSNVYYGSNEAKEAYDRGGDLSDGHLESLGLEEIDRHRNDLHVLLSVGETYVACILEPCANACATSLRAY